MAMPLVPHDHPFPVEPVQSIPNAATPTDTDRLAKMPLVPHDHPFQVELVQSIQNAVTPVDIIRLEKLMTSYLNQLQTNHHHHHQGWSEAMSRWHPNLSLHKLEQSYWSRLKDSDNLKCAIDTKRDENQRVCIHKWEYDPSDRDERTRYTCAHCGKWR